MMTSVLNDGTSRRIGDCSEILPFSSEFEEVSVSWVECSGHPHAASPFGGWLQ